MSAADAPSLAPAGISANLRDSKTSFTWKRFSKRFSILLGCYRIHARLRAVKHHLIHGVSSSTGPPRITGRALPEQFTEAPEQRKLRLYARLMRYAPQQNKQNSGNIDRIPH